MYRRKCDLCGKNILAVYSSDKSFTIYCPECWWSDKWNPIEYGRDYDFSKSFFLQFRELLERIPLIALSVTNLVNCDYCNVSDGDKECYLISGSVANERVMFANRVMYNKDSLDIHIGARNELCYEIINCHQCYRVFFARNCHQCIDSAFLSDCTNCNNCFGCTNLRNKSYYFFNQPYTKDEYQKKIKELNLGSFDIFSQFCQKYKDFSLKQICRFANIVKSVDTTGDNVQHAKNCKFCFDILGNPSAEECKFFVWGGYNCKDSYDVMGVGLNAERFYEALDAERGNRLNFASVVYDSYQIEYSIN
ncbi:MAG: hypothetical protein QME68_08895, partial [Elusimicrobiota bacterium]|nr:hypothetical protein [Elusimicrobiota bacterium]